MSGKFNSELDNKIDLHKIQMSWGIVATLQTCHLYYLR